MQNPSLSIDALRGDSSHEVYDLRVKHVDQQAA